MIKWRKRIPILLVLTLVLALVAMTISAVQFDREKDKELRALQAEKIKADRGALTSAVRTLSPEEQAALEAGGDAAKAGRLDGDPRALLSATAPPAPPKEETGRPTKRDEFGPISIAGPPIQKVVPTGTIRAENDDCHDVTPDALPVHWIGNNEGATYDAYCQWFGDFPNVWHGFTIEECMDITIEYCPTAAGWANGWLNLVTDCDCPDGTLISYTSFDWGCANGNPRMYFLGLEAGTYYYPVMLDPSNGAIGDYDLYVYGTPCPGAPENDDCVDAEAVGDVTNQFFSTAAATPDGDGYTTGPNIWYCYTASCSGIATISLCGSSYDTKLAVYDGCACDPLGTELAYNDDFCGVQSEVSLSVVEGNLYLVEVGGYSSASGDGLLTISCIPEGAGACCYEDGSCEPGMSQEDCEASGGTSWLAGQTCGPPNPCPQPPPPNDNCADATAVGEVTNMAFSTTAATFDGPGNCQTAPNIWYCYTATQSGVATISLCGSGYDTKMGVYDGCTCWGDLLSCNDDACGLQSEVSIAVESGNSYLIEVGGYSSNTGDGILNISVSEPCVLECPPGGHYEDEACGADANGGCNMGTPTFEPILCGDTVCGTVWADGGTRDTDWYELVLEEATLVTWSGMGCFPLVIGFVDTSDCALAAAIDPYAAGDPEVLISCSRVCGPGTYWLFASHQDYYDYPCGMNNDYWAAVTCQPITEGACCYEGGSCEPGMEEEACYASGGTYWMGGMTCDPNPCPQPPYECPEGSTEEPEMCLTDDSEDDTNGGCNSVPPVFGSIDCGETVCCTTSTFLYTGLDYRDTDWLEFELTENMVVTLTGKGGFPLQVLLIGSTGDCANYSVLGSFTVGPDVEGTILLTLPPGIYWAWGGPSVFTGLSCATGPWLYHMTLECEPAGEMYCPASGGGDWEYICNVAVGTINNPSGYTPYSDFTYISTDMDVGTGYPILVDNCNSYSSDVCGCWVDWNQDMDFYDPGEAFTMTGVGGGVAQFEGTITPPGDALSGETTMRVRIVDASFDPLLDPCGTTTYGEVEDYTINVGDGEPEVTYLFEPDPVLVMYKFAIDPMNGYLYLSGDAVGGDVGDMTDVELKVGDCVVPITATEIIDGYGELTGDVLKLTFGIKEYIECEEDGELIYGIGESFFDVYYDMPGSPDQVMNGQVTIIGHTSGDLNLDGSVNVADVTYFVEWLFAGGPAPVILELADVDGSGGNPNVGDLTYLVEYLFNDGPPPMHQ